VDEDHGGIQVLELHSDLSFILDYIQDLNIDFKSSKVHPSRAWFLRVSIPDLTASVKMHFGFWISDFLHAALSTPDV
jgi:hypothetical protein